MQRQSALLSRTAYARGKPDDYEQVKRASERAFERSVRSHHAHVTKQANGSGGSGDVGTNDTYDPRADVYVGTDTTLNPNYGEKYESDDASSMQDAALMGYYNTSSDRLEARAYDYAGYGTFEAWSYIGREFVAHGSGTATITTCPHLDASIGYYGGCGADLTLELVIWDHTDNERWDDTIVSTSQIDEWSQDYVQSHDVYLEDGNGYSAQVKLTVTTTCSGTGGSHSDVTDNNSDTEHVDVGYIDVAF